MGGKFKKMENNGIRIKEYINEEPLSRPSHMGKKYQIGNGLLSILLLGVCI